MGILLCFHLRCSKQENMQKSITQKPCPLPACPVLANKNWLAEEMKSTFRAHSLGKLLLLILERSYRLIWIWDFITESNWEPQKTLHIVREMRHFCLLSFPLCRKKKNGLRDSISFREPKLYMIQLRLGLCVLCSRVKRKQSQKKGGGWRRERERERSKEAGKQRHSSKQQRSVKRNAASFSPKSQVSPGCVHLNYTFRKWKQN